MSFFTGTGDQPDQPENAGQSSRTIQHGQQETPKHRGLVRHLAEVFQCCRPIPDNNIAIALMDITETTIQPALPILGPTLAEKVCPVCLMEYKDWKWMEVVVDECRHEFCSECILRWMYEVVKENERLRGLHTEYMVFACPCCREGILRCEFKHETAGIAKGLLSREANQEDAHSMLLKWVGFTYFKTRANHEKLHLSLRPLFKDLLDVYKTTQLDDSTKTILRGFVDDDLLNGEDEDSSVSSSISELLGLTRLEMSERGMNLRDISRMGLRTPGELGRWEYDQWVVYPRGFV